MARTVTVTKKEVIKTAPNRFTIVLNMQYKEDGTQTVLLDRDYSQEYLSGESPSIYVASWKATMQKDIDDFKSQETVFNAALLNTAVTNIQNGLVV